MLEAFNDSESEEEYDIKVGTWSIIAILRVLLRIDIFITYLYDTIFQNVEKVL